MDFNDRQMIKDLKKTLRNMLGAVSDEGDLNSLTLTISRPEAVLMLESLIDMERSTS